MNLIQQQQKHVKLILIALFLLGKGVISNSYAQTNTSKKQLPVVTENDYGQWERMGGYRMSNDGNWLSYQISTLDLDKTLYIYNTKTKNTKEIKNAVRAAFAENGKWLAYVKALTGKEAKELKKNAAKDNKGSNKPAKLKLLNLVSKDTLEFENVQSYKFSNSSSFIAMKRVEEEVNTLIVKDLTTKVEISFGNVSDYSWQDKGTLLALVIKTKDSVGNSIQLYNPITGNLKVLDHKKAVYQRLQWREDSSDLFAVRTVKNEDYKENNSYALLVWKGLDSNKPSFKVFDQTKFENFPENTRILIRGRNRISMSEDGKSIYFSTFSWERKKNKEDEVEKESDTIKDVSDDDEAPALEIWNSKDLVMISAQKRSSMKDLETPKLAVWKVDLNKFILLEDDLTEKIKLQQENDIVIGLDRTPYDFEAMFGRPNYDVYTVNTNTGAKKKVLSKINSVFSVSPNSQYFTYLTNDNLHLFSIKTGVSINITSDLEGSFITDDDHPLPQKPAYGFAGWSKDSKSFFINSEFDVWQVFPNGDKSIRITKGKEEAIKYRVFNFDWRESELDLSKPVYFTMNGKWNKKSGLAKGMIGKEIKTLIYEDARVSGFSKSEKGDRVFFSKESYTNSKNLYLTTSKFKKQEKITNTNAFQKDYAWGDAVLVDYVNALGKRAQGILYYPANYIKGEKYPMITYVYEKLSSGFNIYVTPSRTDYYNTTVWSQNGYFVFRPDIEFEAGNPGVSSTLTLENAVKAVVDMGDVDAKKVGLIGHSWGGYQAGYVPTQTDIFAASVAGAGLTELIAMNLAVTPAFGGQPENNHFEVGQERMGSAPWKSPDNYIRNSSVMQIEKLNTPILFEVGDNDQNVNWSQGVAYYNAARRANKPFVLLVYANEGHGLRNDKNKIDFQQRILKWFGHYLKGEEAEDWVLEGIPYAEQQKRLKNW